MPFLLFLSLEPCGHVMRVWGGGGKKGGGCMGVWVFSNIRMCGCLDITDYGLHLIVRTQSQ